MSLTHRIANQLILKLIGVKGRSGNFGHKGRPGLRGGSASAKMPNAHRDKPLLRPSEDVSEQDEGRLALSRYILPLDVDPDSIYYASDLKNKIVTDLSEATGISYQKVNRIVGSWAYTANEDDFARAIQEVVSDEFGSAISKWQRNLPPISSKTYSIMEARGITKDDIRKVIRSMYRNTQDELKELGVEEIPLYRGLITSDSSLAPGFDYEIDTNAVESWTTSFKVAQGFAMNMSKDKSKFGVVLVTKVPVVRILCTPRTGFGCMGEEEVLVLGDDERGGDVARVEWMEGL